MVENSAESDPYLKELATIEDEYLYLRLKALYEMG